MREIDVAKALLALLLGRGVFISGRDNHSLHLACRSGHASVVQLLLGHAPGRAIVSCLKAAHGHQHWGVVALLLEGDIDLSHEDWMETRCLVLL